MKIRKYILSFVLILAFPFLFLFPCAFANPQLESQSAGVQVQAGATHTQITQDASQAILHWHSFNVAPTESVHFQQPVNGIILNRVNGANGASEIAGRITATGKVIITNPAGIHFMNSAKVDVAGLIATTGQISDQNFMRGNYQFEESSSHRNGSIGVINDGEINAHAHGFVALIGQRVMNNGKITARLGQVALYSTTKFTLQFGDNDLVHFAIHDDVLQEAVQNKKLQVDKAGNVLVSADTAKSVLDHVIHIPDHFKVRSVHEKDGVIVLSNDVVHEAPKSKPEKLARSASKSQDDFVVVAHPMAPEKIVDDYVMVDPLPKTTPENEYVMVDYALEHAGILDDYVMVDALPESNPENAYVRVEHAMAQASIQEDYVSVEALPKINPEHEKDYVVVEHAMADEAMLHDYLVVVPAVEISVSLDNDLVVQEGFVHATVPAEELQAGYESDDSVNGLLLMSFDDFSTYLFPDTINPLGEIPTSTVSVENVSGILSLPVLPPAANASVPAVFAEADTGLIPAVVDADRVVNPAVKDYADSVVMRDVSIEIDAVAVPAVKALPDRPNYVVQKFEVPRLGCDVAGSEDRCQIPADLWSVGVASDAV
jgi:filamentous hemagglutinin family protein